MDVNVQFYSVKKFLQKPDKDIQLKLQVMGSKYRLIRKPSLSLSSLFNTIYNTSIRRGDPTVPQVLSWYDIVKYITWLSGVQYI